MFIFLMERIKKLYRRIEKAAGGPENMEKINYLVFGGLTTLIDYAVFFLLNALLNNSGAYLVANGIAWVVAVSFAFVTNKLFVFQSRTGSRYALLREAASFFAARLASLGFAYVWMIFAVEAVGMNENIAKLISGAFVIIMNYFFSKLFIFRKSKGGGGSNGAGGDGSGGSNGGSGDGGGGSNGGNSDGNGACGSGGGDGDGGCGMYDSSGDGSNGPGGDFAGNSGASLGWIKNNVYALLSFFTPIAILLIAFAVIEIYPFGKNSILIIDNHHQYTPFLIEFGKILRSGGSLLHSWTAGLGSNYLSRFAYYLSSPLNLFAIFINDSSATEFVLALVLFRAGAAGFAFFFYLKSKFGTQRFLIVAFAAMYSLCSYFLAYYWNIMWFDCIALFPIVVLGIERLVDRGTGGLYCLTLAYTIMSNYFIAIMVCIYSAIYFFAYLASSKAIMKGAPQGSEHRGFKTIIDRCVNFVVYSLLAGAISAIITLPAYMGLLNSSAAGADMPKTARFYSIVVDIIANHLALIKPSIMVGLPNIYCGIAILLLVPIYFINKRIEFREKTANGLLACFFLISFNVNTLDFLWHGTHFPNSLFFRFAFIYVFLILTLSYHALKHISAVGGSELFAIFALLMAFILFMEMQPAEKTTKWTIYGSLLFTLFEALALANLIIKRREWEACAGVGADADAGAGGTPAYPVAGVGALEAAIKANRSHKIAEFMLAALICIEIAVNAGYGIGEAGIFPKQNYLMNTDAIKPTVNNVNSLEGSGGAGFERMEFTTHTTYNTPIIYGYKGISYYSSTSYVAVNELFGKLGLIHSNAWYVYRSAPPTFNSMFAIKYLLSQDGAYDNGIYNEIESTDSVKAYENPYFLPVGFMVDDSVLSWIMSQANPILRQEDFYRRASGINLPLFHRLESRISRQENLTITSGGGADGIYRYRPDDENRSIKATCRVIPQQGGPVYLYISSPKIETVRVQNITASNRGEAEPAGVAKEHNIKYPYVIDAQYARPGDEVEIELVFTSSAADSFTLFAYEFDENVFAEVWKRLSRHGLRVDEYTDTKLVGTIDVNAPGVMYTSIPYDDGWSISVNGVAASIETVGDGALMAIRLPPGRHIISFNYMTPGLIPGMIVTICAVMLLIGMFIYKSLGRKRRSSNIHHMPNMRSFKSK